MKVLHFLRLDVCPRILALCCSLFTAGCGVLLAASGQVLSAATTTATASLPYKLELLEVTGSTLPALHSFSAGTSGGNWVLIGGRIAGLHGFGNGANNFPRSSANTVAYVVNPASNKVLGSIDLVQALTLSPALAGPLTATNAQSVQVGNDLYIVGGYGRDLTTGGSTSGTMITFGSIVKIDVAGLIGAITAQPQKPIASFFVQNPTPDNRLMVTGGELKYSGGNFYLVVGQNFTGDYSVLTGTYNKTGGQFQQYTERVAVFNLTATSSPAAIAINQFQVANSAYDSTQPFNRRDLNVVDTVMADGVTLDATVYGGVFKAGQILGQVNPIQIAFSAAGTLPSTPTATATKQNWQQGLSHYDCANLTLYDATSQSCFTTLFGGISQYHYNSTSNTMVQDTVNLPVDGLPFIATISTIQRSGTAPTFTFTQTIQTVAFPPPPTPTLPSLLGTEAHFLPSAGLTSSQLFTNGVIKLAGITGRTLVGYVYGGIASYGPYSGLTTQNPSTLATNRLFAIWVTPGATSVIPMPPLPTQTTPYP